MRVDSAANGVLVVEDPFDRSENGQSWYADGAAKTKEARYSDPFFDCDREYALLLSHLAD